MAITMTAGTREERERARGVPRLLPPALMGTAALLSRKALLKVMGAGAGSLGRHLWGHLFPLLLPRGHQSPAELSRCLDG